MLVSLLDAITKEEGKPKRGGKHLFSATLRTHMAFNSPGMLLKYFSVDEMHGLGLGPLLDAHIMDDMYLTANDKKRTQKC